MLLTDFRNGSSEKIMFVTHLFLRLGLVVKRTVKFSQEEFQTSLFQNILHIFPDTFPPTCGPELTTGELQQLTSWHSHMERVIPTYPALHLFSWQILHVVISKVCIFLNLDHATQSWGENSYSADLLVERVAGILETHISKLWRNPNFKWHSGLLFFCHCQEV